MRKYAFTHLICSSGYHVILLNDNSQNNFVLFSVVSIAHKPSEPKTIIIYTCPICKENFRRRWEWNRHKQRKHKGQNFQDDKGNVCYVCGEAHRNMAELREHVRVHHTGELESYEMVHRFGGEDTSNEGLGRIKVPEGFGAEVLGNTETPEGYGNTVTKELGNIEETSEGVDIKPDIAELDAELQSQKLDGVTKTVSEEVMKQGIVIVIRVCQRRL